MDVAFVVSAAKERAFDDAAARRVGRPDGRRREKRVAMGDPQAPLTTVLSVLAFHGLLGDDGRLLPEVFLVSMGDHFDWGKPDVREQATRDGTALTWWLASHPPDQVVMLLGNHDTARVGELAPFDAGAFEQARLESVAAYRGGEIDESLEAGLLQRWPSLCDAEVLARDFSCFAVEQRDAVTQLIREKRLVLGHAEDERLLLVHAGLTHDELKALGVAATANAREVSEALQAFLDERVARWSGPALDLAPLHVPGSAAQDEGRGMLFHRPSNPEHERAALFSGPPRRRFDPRTLPVQLTQAIGHIRDEKCRTLLTDWSDDAPAADGLLRSLKTDGVSVSYGHGCWPDATLLFTDAGMLHCPPSRYPLLDLATRQPSEKRAISGM